MARGELEELREVLTKLRIDVGILGEKIDQVKHIGERVQEARDLATSAAKDARAAHKRLDSLEENNKWIKRTLMGAAISSAFSIIVAVVVVATNLK